MNKVCIGARKHTCQYSFQKKFLIRAINKTKYTEITVIEIL